MRWLKPSSTGIVSASIGLSSIVANLVFSGATSSSDGNPATQLDTIVGYGRTLGSRGLWSRTSLFAEMLHQTVEGAANSVSLMQGMSHRVRPRWTVDFAVQQDGLAAGPLEIRFLLGFTYNFGRIRDW